uniref:Uncharacterized protein n=1 Tax=Aegilops tauschii subsp. strangulata TaxID=200361 RepID=A0A453H5I4_AEGTS
MDGYLNYLSLEYDSVWDTKPAWYAFLSPSPFLSVQKLKFTKAVAQKFDLLL